MGKFWLKRILYCILIVLGVMLVTFLLFNLAAGDPAAAVLGDNAAPREIENLRREMGADLPLFFGKRCRTEAFGTDLKRKFHLEGGGEVTAELTFRDGAREEMVLRDSDKELVLPPGEKRELVKTEFFRTQKNPFHSQFFRSFGELAGFSREFPYVAFMEFGNSLTTREPIKEMLKSGVAASLTLMVPVFIGELLLGILLALLAAAFKDRWHDRLLVVLSVLGMSVSFLVAIIFGQWFFGYYCDWFPVWGWGSWRYAVLPVLLAVLCGVGGNVRFYRAVFVDELGKEYLRTAAAKGCGKTGVYAKHLLRNAMLPVITRSTASLPFLFTGSLLLESFFGIPGLGYAGIEALNNSDLQLLKALVIMSALLFAAFNLLADLLYSWADPRVRT